MGDPKKFKKKYKRPGQLWEKGRIEEERAIMSEFGLVNKREIWKANTLLRNFSGQAKKLIAVKSAQSDFEKKQLLDKLVGLGLLNDQNLEAVLDIKLKDVLSRTLQSVVFRKGLSQTVKQARQMITHGHVSVSNQKVTSPSFLVKVAQEPEVVVSSGIVFAVPKKVEVAENV